MNDPYASLNGKDPIDSTKWHTLDVVQLREQIEILTARLNSLQSIGSAINPQTLALCTASIDAAIADIEGIINEKQKPKLPGTL